MEHLHQTPEEVEASTEFQWLLDSRERAEREKEAEIISARLDRYYENRQNKKEVFRTYEERIAILQARLRDGNENLKIIGKSFNVFARTKEEALYVDSLVDVFPAALYGAVIPTLGIPVNFVQGLKETGQMASTALELRLIEPFLENLLQNWKEENKQTEWKNNYSALYACMVSKLSNLKELVHAREMENRFNNPPAVVA